MRTRSRTSSRRRGLRRYLGADETVLLATRQHPLVLAREAIRSAARIVPLALAAWGIAGIEALRGEPGTWLLRVLFLVMVGLVLQLAWHVLAWEFERVVVTDEKVIHVAGVLDRRIASTPLAKVSEFTVRQPLLGRVFDYGSLVVDVPGGRDQALHGLSFLPDPAGLYRLVSDQARRGRVQEGGGRLEEDERDEWTGGESSTATATRVLAPNDEDIARTHRPDPWAPSLEGDAGDHTIRIPRIQPRRPDADR